MSELKRSSQSKEGFLLALGAYAFDFLLASNSLHSSSQRLNETNS